MLESSDNQDFILFALAKEYEKSGRLEEAENTWLKLLSEYPGYTGAYYHATSLKIRLEKPLEALEIGNKGREVCKVAGAMHDLSELESLLESIEN